MPPWAPELQSGSPASNTSITGLVSIRDLGFHQTHWVRICTWTRPGCFTVHSNRHSPRLRSPEVPLNLLIEVFEAGFSNYYEESSQISLPGLRKLSFWEGKSPKLERSISLSQGWGLGLEWQGALPQPIKFQRQVVCQGVAMFLGSCSSLPPRCSLAVFLWPTSHISSPRLARWAEKGPSAWPQGDPGGW